MGIPSESFRENKAFFHALGKVNTNSGQNVFESLYKSSHNITAQDIWTENVDYCANSAVADAFVNSNPTIVKKYFKVPLTPIPGSNRQAWYLEDGGEFIKNWISPVDVPHIITKSPSNGFQARLYDNLGVEIPLSSGVWVVDYYAGMVLFQDSQPIDVQISCYVYIGQRGDLSSGVSGNIGDAISVISFRNITPAFPIEGEKYIIGDAPSIGRKQGNIGITSYSDGTTYRISIDGVDYDYLSVVGDDVADVATNLSGLINADNSCKATTETSGGLIHIVGKYTTNDYADPTTSIQGGSGTIGSYIGSSRLGDWTGRENQIAQFYTGFWKYYSPSKYKIYFNNEDQFWYRWNGTVFNRIQSEANYYVDFNNGDDDNMGISPSSPAKTVNKIFNSITTSKEPSPDGYVIINLLSDYDFSVNPVILKSTFWYDVIIQSTYSNITTVDIVSVNSGMKTCSNWGATPTVTDEYCTSFFGTGATLGHPVLSHDATNILGFISDGTGVNVNQLDNTIVFSDNFIFGSSSHIFAFKGDLAFQYLNINNSNINISYNELLRKDDFILMGGCVLEADNITSLPKIKYINDVIIITDSTSPPNGNIYIGEYASNLVIRSKIVDDVLKINTNNSKIYNIAICNLEHALDCKKYVDIENMIVKSVLKLVNMNKNAEVYIKGDVILDKGGKTSHFDVLGDTDVNVKLMGNEINSLYFNDGETSVSFGTSKGLKYNSEYHVMESTYDIRAYMPLFNGYRPIDTDYYTFIITGNLGLGSNALVPLVFMEEGKNIYKIYVKINIDGRNAGDDDVVFDIKVGNMSYSGGDYVGGVTYGTITLITDSIDPNNNENEKEINCDITVNNDAISKGDVLMVNCTTAGGGGGSGVEDITIDIEIK